MGLAGVVLLSVGGENLVGDCAGVEGFLGGNAVDFEGGCFLDAEAVNAVSHRSPVREIDHWRKQRNIRHSGN